MDIFHKLHREQGKTIVLITHSRELAAETERIITISDGRIISDKDNRGTYKVTEHLNDSAPESMGGGENGF